MNRAGWIVGTLAALGLCSWGLLFGACGLGTSPCETDLDCVIICDCPGLSGEITIGPYVCSGGTCGAGFDRDKDCQRPCEDSFVPPNYWDDDDSAGDDDDDSAVAGDDDDSAGG